MIKNILEGVGIFDIDFAHNHEPAKGSLKKITILLLTFVNKRGGVWRVLRQ